LIAGLTAAAFYEVGEFTAHNPAFGTLAHAENVLGHAAVGCASAVASGAKCGPSALAGGITSFAGPVINTSDRVASLLRNTVIGGLAAVAGGGKFSNGAFTAAFGYLYNAAAGKIASLREPGPNEIAIVINNNDGFGAGTHAGMFIGDRLYDPGGDYANQRGRKDPDYLTSLNDYVSFQLEDGNDVRIYRFTLGSTDMTTILGRTADFPGSAGFCAANVQSCIAGIGPFIDISATWLTTPASLANRLNTMISGGTGSCMGPSGQKC